MKKLLAALFVLWLVELALSAAGIELAWLAWLPLGLGFEPWQLVTRFLVQGPGNLLGVLLGLLVLWFALPVASYVLTRRQLAELVGAAALGGTVLPLLLDVARWSGAISTPPAPIGGWTPLVLALVLAFGLADPGGTIRLYFVLPVRASWFVWGTLGFALLLLLQALALGASLMSPLEHVGIWAGAYGWWHLRGPGRRRRDLVKKARGIERELARFRVIPGGRDHDLR